MNGFLLIDKDSGWTSRDVCNKIEHLFHTKKVGHIGTLDPFATGLLVVSLGNGTKASRFIEDLDKEYIATLTFGKKTSTGDLNGETVKEVEVPILKKDDILKVLKEQIGKQKQVPPMTSAVHFNGQKLYTLAHQGIEVEREARDIEIKNIEFLSFSNNSLTFKCVVSKGTYIRVLGETIAEKLGTLGYLSSLRRTKIGDYSVDDASNLDYIQSAPIFEIGDILKKHLFYINLPLVLVKRVKDGAKIKFDNIPLEHDKILLLTEDGSALAVYQRYDNDLFSCVRGLW